MNIIVTHFSLYLPHYITVDYINLYNYKFKLDSCFRWFVSERILYDTYYYHFIKRIK